MSLVITMRSMSNFTYFKEDSFVFLFDAFINIVQVHIFLIYCKCRLYRMKESFSDDILLNSFFVDCFIR